MKMWYHKDARNRVFKPGDKVLVFFSIPGHVLQARYNGPHEIESKFSDVNYVVQTLDRRKEKRICHIYILKEYFERCDRNYVKPVSSQANAQTVQNCIESDMSIEMNEKYCNQSARLKNSEMLAGFEAKLGHLNNHHQNKLKT